MEPQLFTLEELVAYRTLRTGLGDAFNFDEFRGFALARGATARDLSFFAWAENWLSSWEAIRAGGESARSEMLEQCTLEHLGNLREAERLMRGLEEENDADAIQARIDQLTLAQVLPKAQTKQTSKRL